MKLLAALRWFLILAVCAVSGAVIAQAEGIRTVQVSVTDAIARPLAPARNDAEVVLELTNTGQTDLVLESASSNVAARAVIHTTIILGGQLKMRDVTSYTLPAGGGVRFAAGGMHLMLFDLKQPLTVGSMVDITLHFQGGAEHTFSAAVSDEKR